MKTLNQIKQEAVIQALRNNGFNQSKAAEELGVSRGGLRALLKGAIGHDVNKEQSIKLFA